MAPTVVVACSRSPEAQRVARYLRQRGFRVETARDGEAALNAFDSLRPDAVVADRRLQRLDGSRLLSLTRRRAPEICFVLVTDRPDVEEATEAMRAGAHDVQVGPIDLDRLGMVLDRGVTQARLRRQVNQLEHRLDRKYGFDNLVGSSAPMIEVLTRIRQIAPTRATVLITRCRIGSRSGGKASSRMS